MTQCTLGGDHPAGGGGADAGEEDAGERIFLHLSVDDQDKGKVIGRDGRVAQSMRSLLRVAAVKANTRVSLEID